MSVRRSNIVVIVLLGTIALGFLSRATWAQGVTLEVQPSSIAVSPSYSEVQARVVLKNTGAVAVSHLHLSPLSNDGLATEIAAPSSDSAQKGQAVVWPVKVVSLGRARIPGSVLFDASYKPPNTKLAQHVFALLSVTSQTDAQQKPIEASLEGNLDAVSQQRPATAYLLVTNNLDVPVHVQINPLISEETLAPPPIAPRDIPARSATPIKVEVKPGIRVTPGTYPLLLEVIAEWAWAGHSEQRRVVVSKPVTVGIFFESEVLKALGIPSFLVLPGCLVLFTMQLLLTLGFLGVKNESRLPQLNLTTPGFWILAITFSGLFAVVYNLATGANYLVRYGLGDLRNVWLSSIVIGAILYSVLALVTQKRRRERVPTVNDEPIDVLRKLSRNGLQIVLPKVKFKLVNLDLSGFVIEKIEDGQTLVWVAPSIAITRVSASEDALATQQELVTAVDSRRKASELAETLEEAKTKNYATVRWDSRGAMPNPFHLKVEAITEYQQPEVFVNFVN